MVTNSSSSLSTNLQTYDCINGMINFAPGHLPFNWFPFPLCAQLDNLTLMEINTVRPFLTQALDHTHFLRLHAQLHATDQSQAADTTAAFWGNKNKHDNIITSTTYMIHCKN